MPPERIDPDITGVGVPVDTHRPAVAAGGTVTLDAKTASENAGKWLETIGILTGAAALATTLGLKFAPDTLADGQGDTAKISALAAVVLAAIAIFLAAMAAQRTPTAAYWDDASQARAEEQDILNAIKNYMVGSRIAAALAVVALLFSLWLSTFGDHRDPTYLLTVNTGTPSANTVVCGPLHTDTSTGQIYVIDPQGRTVPATDHEALLEIDAESCPGIEAAE